MAAEEQTTAPKGTYCCGCTRRQCAVASAISAIVVSLAFSMACLAVGLGIGWGIVQGPITYVFTAVVVIIPMFGLMILAGIFCGEPSPKIILFLFSLLGLGSGLAVVAFGIAYLATGVQSSGGDSNGTSSVLLIIPGVFVVLGSLLCCASSLGTFLFGLYCVCSDHRDLTPGD